MTSNIMANIYLSSTQVKLYHFQKKYRLINTHWLKKMQKFLLANKLVKVLAVEFKIGKVAQTWNDLVSD